MGLVLPPGLAKVTTDSSLSGSGTTLSPLKTGPIAAATIAGNNTGSAIPPTGLTDVQAQAVLGIDVLSVKDSSFGAVGNYNPITGAGTDDLAAFALAVSSAISSNKALRLPPGNYKLSKYLPILNARGLRIIGSSFATIYYASDDISVIPDLIATSNAQCRSAIYLRNCQDVSIENVIFVGGTSPELTSVNTGVGIYATNCSGTRVTNCRAIYGNTLFVQDAIAPTYYPSGNSCSVSGSVVTLTNAGDPNGAFNLGMVGRTVTITNATNPVNNGVFIIRQYISSTQLTYVNASAIAEATSSLIWTISDGDSDTAIVGCSLINCRGVSYTGSGGVFADCTFQRPMTQDMAGVPDSVTCTGTTSVMTDANASWSSAVVGRYIKVGGSTNAFNNGVFPITAVTPSTNNIAGTITFTNTNNSGAGGVSETCPFGTCYWWLAGGEKSAIGNGASAIANSSGVVTFTANQSLFVPSDVLKVIVITDATSLANNGAYVITRYISATQIQYCNSAAVSEAYAKVFTVDGYDSTKGDQTVGPPVARSSTSVSANTLTDTGLAAVVNAYASRILTDSTGRNWSITSNTSTAFTLAGSGTPAAGAYTVTAGDTHGSTHGIYYFAGRSQVKVLDCKFYGIRTTAIKISGSNLPIRDVEVSGNTFFECGAATIWGADDSQEHTSLNFHHNHIQDCSTGRQGWNDQFVVGLYGGRNVQIHDNQFHAKHDAIPALVNTGSVGGYYPIFVGRYRPGISQPCEDVSICRNSLTIDPYSAAALRVAGSTIHCERIGQRAKWATGGTLTQQLTGPLSLTISTTSTGSVARAAGSWVTDGYASGQSIAMTGFTNGGNNVTKVIASVTALTITFTSNTGLVNETHSASTTNGTMTLNDPNAEFAQVNVGDSIQISFAPNAGNNNTLGVDGGARVVDFTILSVGGTSTVTYTNMAGVGGGVSAGTYRVKPKTGAGGRRGGTCLVSENRIGGYGSTGVEMIACCAPEIVGNIFNGMSGAISDQGSSYPRIVGNREVSPVSTGARIVITTGTSWPFFADNLISNPALLGGDLSAGTEGPASRTDMGIGVGNTTSIDYPLRGKSGRAIVTNAHTELMFAFGSELVDGDTFSFNGVAKTYKTTSPGANQFNSIASLLSILTGSGFTAADYGAALAGAPTTGHVKVSTTGSSVVVRGFYFDVINVLNDTALCIPRNDTAGTPPESLQYNVGEGDAGGVSRRLVVWSPACCFAGSPMLQPYNAAAALLMSGASYYPEKNIKNAGTCEVINITKGTASINSSSTAVAANSLTDTGQAMTVNAFAGYWLVDHAGAVFQIISNTATVFTLAASGTTPTAGGYVVCLSPSPKSASALSSTSTAVAANSLTDSVPVMVTNQYQGYYLKDSAGVTWPIASNTTGGVFTLTAGGATPAAGAYTINAGPMSAGSTAEFMWTIP